MPGSDQSEVLKRLVKSVIAYGRAYIIRHCLHVGVAVVHAYAVAHSLKHLLVVHAVAKAYCVGNYILAQKFAQLTNADPLVEIQSENLAVKTSNSFKVLHAENKVILQNLHWLVKLAFFGAHENDLVNGRAVVFAHRFYVECFAELTAEAQKLAVGELVGSFKQILKPVVAVGPVKTLNRAEHAVALKAVHSKLKNLGLHRAVKNNE